MIEQDNKNRTVKNLVCGFFYLAILVGVVIIVIIISKNVDPCEKEEFKGFP